MVAMIAAAALAAACGDDDGDRNGNEDEVDDEQAVEEVLRRMGLSDPASEDDVAYFLAHSTDNFIDQISGMARQECRDNPVECIGEPSDDVRVDNVAVDGETAAGDLTFIDGGSEFQVSTILVREDGVWKIDDFAVAIIDVPEGVTQVEVTATEYEFQYDAPAIEDGNVAFALINEGEVAHELALVKVTDDFDADSLFGDGDVPPFVEEFIGFTFARPGEVANVVPDGALDPGRYLILCRIEDDDGRAHAALGMYSEFAIE